MPPKKKGNSDAVRVAIRVRPHTATDGGDNRTCMTMDSEHGQIICKDPDGKKIEKAYNFDTVFATTSEQKDIFECIGSPMVESALEGYNVTLFTYGQTGSGKTYTIQGLPGAGVRVGQDYDIEQHKGLTPRIAEYLFERVADMVDDEPALSCVIEMSYLEIYNESVRDLLVAKKDQTGLEVREDSKGKPYVEGLQWRKCLSTEKIMEHLLLGNTRRQVAATKMNEVSSRSHSIVMLRTKMTFDPPNPLKPDTEALLYIVDLAGSERIDKTGAEGDTLSEAKNINKSLLMLGRAIHAFGDKGPKAHVPLRDSKLTRLLKESFGGNSKTWMIATCSSSPYNMVETKSTLDYAANAKLVTNAAQQNKMARQLELAEQRDHNKKLEKEIADLKDKLANYEANRQEEAQKLAVQMNKGASTGMVAELEALKRENKKLQDDLNAAAETEGELRRTIAKGVKSDIADQLRKELDAVKAENSKLKRELEETSNMENRMGRGRDTAKKSAGSHLRTGSPTQGMGGKRPSMQKQMQDLLDDPNMSYEERVKRMENRALVESAGSFVRKKSFNQLYQQSTGYAPRGSWGGQRPHTYASIQNGSSLQELQRAKDRAIANEDFTEAQRLTEEIKCMQAQPSVGMNDLMAARARAIATDDFVEAQKIQAQINVLKARQAGVSGAQTPRDAQMMNFNAGGGAAVARPLGEDVQGGNRAMFVGRASISLRFLVQGTTPSKYHTLPLECSSNITLDNACPPQLLVNIYKLDNKKGQPDDGRMDFVVHVIQAKGIPKPYSQSVHCKYVFKWGEKEYYKSDEVKMSTEPQFDYKKRYAFPKITDQLYGWFTSENVMTFEVIGLGAAGGAKHADPVISVTNATAKSDPRDAAGPAGSARRQGSPYY
ncbi:Kinesin heavy chain [Diplonema papillatum]|nr:Kinesin heavy chain [Diplonema papillatum]